MSTDERQTEIHAGAQPRCTLACPPGTELQHLGLRCVMTAEMWKSRNQSEAEASEIKEK
jgi:hypothetical protein